LEASAWEQRGSEKHNEMVFSQKHLEHSPVNLVSSQVGILLSPEGVRAL